MGVGNYFRGNIYFLKEFLSFLLVVGIEIAPRIHTVEDGLNAQFGFEMKSKLNSSAAMVEQQLGSFRLVGFCKRCHSFSNFLTPRFTKVAGSQHVPKICTLFMRISQTQNLCGSLRSSRN